ncbi:MULTISPECIES: MerR family transcriptional regulator [Microbacterium]|uniref:MerR family transcriptional regulator n=1 Tax=Microbacterium TaxID=33882 RepID=UPI00217E43EF|nr:MULTISPECIES: MerR family transcriptional regulator [Microbacterium]UWF77663.1 MerR family transcriptional regulator [Microbacterium neungamense]WCM55832.1 MerR family transcriptional regulator [Microbacterium sp. EF45047]
MKLSELSRATGVGITTLKHWLREGILPGGRLRNQTTAEYEQRHVDRVLLIRTMREDYNASIAAIRTLTSLIDDAASTTLDVMRACQAFVIGAPEDVATNPAYEPYRQRTHELMRIRDWHAYPSAAEQGLAYALAQAAAVGLDYSVEQLMEYADALEPLAHRHIAALGPDGSADVVARRMLIAVRARAQQLLAISHLAHAAMSVRAAIERGDAPPSTAAPPPR